MQKLVAVLLALSLASLSACEGEQGPMGPAGAQGPQGEPGPGTRMVMSATVGSSGVGGVNLPSVVGSLSDPPGLTCYLGEPGSGEFLLVSIDTYSGVACGLAQNGGALQAIIIDAPPGWTARFVVVY